MAVWIEKGVGTLVSLAIFLHNVTRLTGKCLAGWQFALNIVLTIIAWLPGAVHALYVLLRTTQLPPQSADSLPVSRFVTFQVDRLARSSKRLARDFRKGSSR